MVYDDDTLAVFVFITLSKHYIVFKTLFLQSFKIVRREIGDMVNGQHII
jgi:hypothetical protein